VGAGGARAHVGDGAGGRRASGRAWLYAVGAGACYAGDLYVWHRSILLSGTGLATLLANTQVFWVALLSALLLGERLTWRLALCAALALLGVVLLAIPGIAKSPLHLHGIGLGLATGVFYAGYYLFLRASQREPRRLSLAANLWVTCAVAAALLFAAAVATGESIPWPGSRDLGLLLLLGVGAHVGGWVAISRGMTVVPAATGSLLLLLQPVLATIWGITVFSEPFGWLRDQRDLAVAGGDLRGDADAHAGALRALAVAAGDRGAEGDAEAVPAVDRDDRVGELDQVGVGEFGAGWPRGARRRRRRGGG
jgi:drug/metabolite transporter (DMT)-like permease